MLRLEFGLLLQMINTSVIRRSILMKRLNNKHLTAMKAYRLSPTLAHSLYTTANKLDLTESAFVRMVLNQAIDRIQGNCPFRQNYTKGHTFD